MEDVCFETSHVHVTVVPFGPLHPPENTEAQQSSFCSDTVVVYRFKSPATQDSQKSRDVTTYDDFMALSNTEFLFITSNSNYTVQKN
jgi:hypothetical protein